MCGTDQDKERLVKRLNRIEGQIAGVRKMIERDADCMETLRQISSAAVALRGVWLQAVGDHIRGCVERSDFGKKNRTEILEELLSHIEKVR